MAVHIHFFVEIFKLCTDIEFVPLSEIPLNSCMA